MYLEVSLEASFIHNVYLMFHIFNAFLGLLGD